MRVVIRIKVCAFIEFNCLLTTAFGIKCGWNVFLFHLTHYQTAREPEANAKWQRADWKFSEPLHCHPDFLLAVFTSLA
jgi:hypothetical protein